MENVREKKLVTLRHDAGLLTFAKANARQRAKISLRVMEIGALLRPASAEQKAAIHSKV